MHTVGIVLRDCSESERPRFDMARNGIMYQFAGVIDDSWVKVNGTVQLQMAGTIISHNHLAVVLEYIATVPEYVVSVNIAQEGN